MESLSAISERTGETMKITPTRLRRTRGTRAAMEGHGVLVIAELLDHSDTQNAGVYVEARPEIVERIDKALALHLAPLAQAFASPAGWQPPKSDHRSSFRRRPKPGRHLRPAWLLRSCGTYRLLYLPEF
jgi:hypothetical protein